MRTDPKKGRLSRPVFNDSARAASLRTRRNKADRYSLELVPAVEELLASRVTSLGRIASGLKSLFRNSHRRKPDAKGTDLLGKPLRLLLSSLRS